jgi:hypothetical protein
MKKYNVSAHAAQRAVERLGCAPEHAANHLTQLMQMAYYNGDVPNKHGGTAKVFDHYKSRTRLIVSPNDTIITVYRMEDQANASKPNIFADEIKRLVARQLAKETRNYTKQRRAFEIEAAELALDIAQLRLCLLYTSDAADD